MRRTPLTIAMVVAALLVAACASDTEPDQVAGNGGSAGTATSSPVAGNGPAGTTTQGNTTVHRNTTAKPATTTTTQPGGSGSGTGTNSSGTTTTDIRPLPTTVPGDDGSQGPPGAFARTLLRPQPATAIVFERFEQQGASPRQASLDHVIRILGDVTGKPVTGNGPIVVPGGARDWTADELRSTADTLTTAGQGNGRAVLHVLFLKGTFEGDERILGVTVRGDVIAMFTDRIVATATVTPRAELEAAVLTHEVGHTLGLVDLARDTGRDDPTRPGHSKNTKSVMYWAVESSLVNQVLQGPPPRDFDADDLADLRALRNGA